MNEQLFHATAIAIAGKGVMITGPSGSGKSDLALRLIDRGAVLISDDAVLVEADCSPPLLKSAPNIEGKLELRNIGIVSLEYVPAVPLHMIVDLSDKGERMPAERLTIGVGRHDIPVFKLNPFDSSAPLKVEFALRAVIDDERHTSNEETREKIVQQV